MRIWREMLLSASSMLIIVVIIIIVLNPSAYTKTHESKEQRIFPLTNLIRTGQINRAKEFSYVEYKKIKSYSGFLTVNETHNSNLFFWYFPTTLKPTRKRRVYLENVPLILWLQGGPGTSSLFGLFVENGPFKIDSDLNLSIRKYSWTKSHSMLFIDNPVGTGFSFTNNENGYSRTEEDVAQNLYTALRQFFKLFPEVSESDFYIAGESYAGKYVPMLSMKIHHENQLIRLRGEGNFINLKGLVIGGGFCDPINMITSYADYLYFTGLINERSKNHFKKQGLLTQQLIKDGNYTGAYIIQDELFGGDFISYPTYFKNKTGFDYYHNLLEPNFPEEPNYYDEFVQLKKTRSSIHVGNTPFERQSEIVAIKLKNEIFKSVRSVMEELLALSYQVLLYVGQLDIVVPHLAVSNFINHLQWKGKSGYEMAERKILRNSQDEILGYLQQNANFNYVLVRNAGHQVPFDQPKWCLDLINRFTHGTLL